MHSVCFTNQSLFLLFLSCLFLDSDQKKLNKSWFPSTRRRTDKALGMFVSLVRPRQTGRSQPTVQLPAPHHPLPLRETLHPQHQSEPGLICIFQRTAVSAFTVVQTQKPRGHDNICDACSF